jgi:hypothetical protein
MVPLIRVPMFNIIADAFTAELRTRRSLQIIVSDSSDEEPAPIQSPIKRKRGRPRKSDIREETIDLISEIDLAVQEVKIEGSWYNKCIYTNELYNVSGEMVGRYDERSNVIRKEED